MTKLLEIADCEDCPFYGEHQFKVGRYCELLGEYVLKGTPDCPLPDKEDDSEI